MASGSIRGLRALGETVVRVTRPLIGDRRAPLSELQAAWSQIVDRRLALLCRPARLAMPPRARVGGTLHVQVTSGAVALQLQHEAPLLIERINGFLGFAAVARLKLIHAPFPVTAKHAGNASLLAALGDRRAAASVPLDGISDPHLREALARLARRVAGDDSPRPAPHDAASACPHRTSSL